MLIYKSIQKDEYIYSIEIQVSNYKFTVFPMIYIKLYNNKGFALNIGLFFFFIEIVKIKDSIDEEVVNLFKEMLKQKGY